MNNFISSVSLNLLIGVILKKIRQSQKKKLSEVSENTNLPTSTISKIENSLSNLSIDHIFLLCECYKIRVSQFILLIEDAFVFLHKEKNTYVFIEPNKKEKETNFFTVPTKSTILPFFLSATLITPIPIIGLLSSYSVVQYLKKKKESKKDLPILTDKQLLELLDSFLIEKSKQLLS